MAQTPQPINNTSYEHHEDQLLPILSTVAVLLSLKRGGQTREREMVHTIGMHDAVLIHVSYVQNFSIKSRPVFFNSNSVSKLLEN
jgi:tRNA G37 N-methylase Trm5